jgi:hypothetical protein
VGLLDDSSPGFNAALESEIEFTLGNFFSASHWSSVKDRSGRPVLPLRFSRCVLSGTPYFPVLKVRKMGTTALASHVHAESIASPIQLRIEKIIGNLLAQLPNPQQLTSEQRRGIIARYTAVLEANFIYWMTAASIAVKCDEVRPILAENLYEEVRDAHPVMLRRFAIGAHAFPTDSDALAIDADLTKVRLFLGKLQGVQSVLTMAFFEGFIQRFMGYLASLAAAQGSTEMEYTDVHGVCDVHHTAELYRALELEMAVNPVAPDADLFEGVDLLRHLIVAIVDGPAAQVAE